MALRSTIGNFAVGDKWEAIATMMTLVRELESRLEENGLLDGEEENQIANAYYAVNAQLPKRVQETLRNS